MPSDPINLRPGSPNPPTPQQQIDIRTSIGAAAESHSHTGFALTNHSHPDLAEIGHTHPEFGTFALANHTHNQYSLTSHTHDEFSTLSPLNHTHPEFSTFALASHTHNQYSPTSHSHPEFSTFAPLSHTHSQYALTNHGHPDLNTNVATFTPSLTGWHRIITDVSKIGGWLTISCDDTNRLTDIHVDLVANSVSRGVITQQRASGTSPIVTQIRTAANQSGRVVVDIFVITAGFAITLKSAGLYMPAFESSIVRIVPDILDSQTNMLETVSLTSPGFKTNAGVYAVLGSPKDPGTTFQSSGRGIVTHGLTLRAGGDGFSDASDHFHLFFQGGPGSRSGMINASPGVGTDGGWNQFQMQNSNSPSTNSIFLGGISSHFYNTTEFGNATKLGVSTDRVQTTGSGGGAPVGPSFSGEIDLWYTSSSGIPGVGTHISVRFLPGIAGLAAASYAGLVLDRSTLTAPNGLANACRLRIRILDLSLSNWAPAFASAFVADTTSWRTNDTPPPIGVGGVSLAPHAARSDTFVATFTNPHDLGVGHVVALRFLNTVAFMIGEGTHTGYVSKVISPTSLEIRMGRASFSDYNLNGVPFTTRTSLDSNGNPNDMANPANTLLIKYDPWYAALTTGEPIRLESIGELPTGLALNTTYWIKKTGGLPFIELYNAPDVNNPANQVSFTLLSGRGYHFVKRLTPLAPLGATGWTLHSGCQDIVHHQTVADLGFKLHRNIVPNNGIAPGVITSATFGGLCDVTTMANVAYASGFNSKSEKDFTLTCGINLTNTTPRSAEYGFGDVLKLSCKEDRVDLLSGTSSTFSLRAGGGVELGVLNVSQLPNAAAFNRVRYEVTDASGPVIGSAVVGGGSADCTVRSNGTTWVVIELL